LHSSSSPTPRRPEGEWQHPFETPAVENRPVHTSNVRGQFRDPRQFVSEIEASPELPCGNNERFAGYGVMGLPFQSGHLLAMRRFPASSVGPAYTSVWHRNPFGRWTFFQDAAPSVTCTRYFGAAVDEVVHAAIEIRWSTPSELTVTVVVEGEHRLDWRIRLTTSNITRLMNSLVTVSPDSWWRSHTFLMVVSRLIHPVLRTGRLRLSGVTPNGQRFAVNPSVTWLVPEATATLDGSDLGEVGAAPTQGRLGDFRIPQRGIFALGCAFFEPAVGDTASRSCLRCA
jgi:hypothetical protein